MTDPVAAQPAWVAGDATGLQLPAHGEALGEGGTEWLTRAFRAFGSLASDNCVTRITRLETFQGGGTGTKALLSVTYQHPGTGLHERLFVKFSRNYADPAMDAAKFHMEPEVRFAALSHVPDFPIAVAPCMFADYAHDSGTGLMITQAIPFGRDGIEREYAKCLDHEMPEPLAHYRALIGTLARLAGAFKGGLLPPSLTSEFPWDRERALAADRLPYSPEQLDRRISRYAAFSQAHGSLLPAAIRTGEFIASLREGAALFQAREDAIKHYLHDREEMTALCHWNANADNAWYWRGGALGELQCGLLDWGSVGQMHLAMSLWGCLSSAEQWLWRDHLDELLALFVSEYAAAGGPVIEAGEMKRHLLLYVATMGLCWLMDAPPRIQREVSDLDDCLDRLDPRIIVSETARVQLQMLTNFLCLWQSEGLTESLRHDFVGVG